MLIPASLALWKKVRNGGIGDGDNPFESVA